MGKGHELPSTTGLEIEAPQILHCAQQTGPVSEGT